MAIETVGQVTECTARHPIREGDACMDCTRCGRMICSSHWHLETRGGVVYGPVGNMAVTPTTLHAFCSDCVSIMQEEAQDNGPAYDEQVDDAIAALEAEKAREAVRAQLYVRDTQHAAEVLRRALTVSRTMSGTSAYGYLVGQVETALLDLGREEAAAATAAR